MHPTWPWFIIILMSFRIKFVKVLLRLVAEIFIYKIAHFVLFFQPCCATRAHHAQHLLRETLVPSRGLSTHQCGVHWCLYIGCNSWFCLFHVFFFWQVKNTEPCYLGSNLLFRNKLLGVSSPEKCKNSMSSSIK